MRRPSPDRGARGLRSSPRACRDRRCRGWTRFRRSRTCVTTLDPPVGSFGAHEELQLLLLLITALALLLLADRAHIPYPILLVVGGLVLGFAPGVPTVILPPDAV